MNTSASLRLEEVRRRYRAFIAACDAGSGEFRLTPNAEPSAHARCFAVYGLALLREERWLTDHRQILAPQLRQAVRDARRLYPDRPTDKSYRQLLTFTLSALAALEALQDDPLDDLVREQLPPAVEAELNRYGCLQGAPQSGNQAMFIAIFLLHADRWLGVDTRKPIETWIGLHRQALNRFGFWGAGGMTHLQFQNAYHQYEILEYLGIENPKRDAAAAAVAAIADDLGHFGPYPGGGGCYDYDALFILTPEGRWAGDEARVAALRAAMTILGEQREDGGFADSLFVRPRSVENLLRFCRHVAAARNRHLLLERLRIALALQRGRYSRIHTDWSRYARRWDESDLWNSWFRMLALARTAIALDPGTAETWGFIDYPGIGYHPSLRRRARS